MIDVKKTRNNFQKFPSLKQRCDPVIVVKTQTATKPTQQTATNQKNTKSQTSTSATRTATTTITTTSATTKQIHSTKVYGNPSTKSDTAAKSNPVRDANQHFFLVQEFKDKNFLKAECELAHAQVSKPTAIIKNTSSRTLLPVVIDNRRASNKFTSTNNNSVSISSHTNYLNDKFPNCARCVVQEAKFFIQTK